LPCGIELVNAPVVGAPGLQRDPGQRGGVQFRWHRVK
jgi:hypothetical protein